jgi:hypothetical protein
MQLAKDYCKEILRQLDQLAVYLPGRQVDVGDVITFGPVGLFSRPLGDFQLVTTLEKLKVNVDKRTDVTPQSYRYASREGTSVSFNGSADAGQIGSGKLTISFSKSGALYLAALNCTREEMTNVNTLERQLVPLQNELDWNNCYIVTSVTRAGRAVIMQSSTTNAEMVIEGQTKQLVATPGNPIDVNAQFNVTSYKEASFQKDWSNESPLFMTLVRYKMNWLGDWKATGRSFSFRGEKSALAEASYKIVSMSKEEILEEEEVLVG